MRVRLARQGDLEAVTAMAARLWPDDTVEAHREHMRAVLAGRPRSTLPLVVLLAEDGGRPVGFAEVGLRSHVDGCDASRPCGYLEGWFVEAGWRGRGVGRLLVAAAEAWARERGAVEMGSDTWIDAEVSQRAHAALGYEVVDRCVNFRKRIAAAPAEAPAFYGVELARAHHEHFGHVARAAAEELLARLGRAGIASGTVVDLATGTAILARRAAEAGFDVVGVDLSPGMLAVAREHAAGVTLVEASLWDFELPPCVAVCAIGEALSYAADPAAGPDRLDARLASIRRALASGGVLLLDVAGPGRSGPTGARRSFFSYPGGHLGVEEREEGRTLTRAITHFVEEGTRFRRLQETHVLRLLAPGELEAALARAGFSAERLPGYAALELGPGWHAYAAW